MYSGNPIPVLMYHSVGRKINDWKWSFLTIPVNIFENQLIWLSKKKYKTCTLTELYEHVKGKKTLPEKTVIFTFDDGYLDNWTYAYPLLERYGFNATVFVNPEFVDTDEVIRPNLKDVWSKNIEESDLPVRGFMSWNELRILTDSKIFSVQSHSMSHTWYPINNEVIDFHHPGDGYYWLDWNNDKNLKPYYLLEPNKSTVPLGTPVYAHGKALECTKYYPDQRESNYLCHYVANNGNENFFKMKEWRKNLKKILELFRLEHPNIGKYETLSERNKRLNNEMADSKDVIEKNIKCKVDHFAWPGGGYDEYAMEQSKKIYLSVTLSSKDRSNLKNRIGENQKIVKRIGVPYIENGNKIIYVGGRYLIRYLEEFTGNSLSRKRRQVLKILFIIKSTIKEKFIGIKK